MADWDKIARIMNPGVTGIQDLEENGSPGACCELQGTEECIHGRVPRWDKGKRSEGPAAVSIDPTNYRRVQELRRTKQEDNSLPPIVTVTRSYAKGRYGMGKRETYTVPAGTAFHTDTGLAGGINSVLRAPREGKSLNAQAGRDATMPARKPLYAGLGVGDHDEEEPAIEEVLEEVPQADETPAPVIEVTIDLTRSSRAELVAILKERGLSEYESGKRMNKSRIIEVLCN